MSDIPDAVADTESRTAESDPRENSALAPVLPYILRTFHREPALALTAAYLLVALAGIYYDYWFYLRNFGIPVLTLSQVGDFLVAGIQQPAAFVLVVVTVPLCWLLDRVNIRFNRRHHALSSRLRALPKLSPWQQLRLHWATWNLSESNRRLSQVAYLLLIICYGWMFVSILANQRADAIRAGAGPFVTVRLTGDAADLSNSTGTSWSYLGAVSNYVFVYDHVAKRALILPVNAVASIQPIPVKGKPKLPSPVVRLP